MTIKNSQKLRKTTKIAANPELIQQLKIKTEESILSDPLPSVADEAALEDITSPLAKSPKKDHATSKKTLKKIDFVVDNEPKGAIKEKETAKPGQKVKRFEDVNEITFQSDEFSEYSIRNMLKNFYPRTVSDYTDIYKIYTPDSLSS